MIVIFIHEHVIILLIQFEILDGFPLRKRLKTEEDDREKIEKSSSSVDAILEDVIKGGTEETGKLPFL